MKLTGPQYEQLQRALISAFPKRADLEQMLLFQLGESLDTIVGSGNLSDTIFGLIQWAVARGRLDELIAGAQRSNPGNIELRVFVEQVWQARGTAESSQPADRTALAEQDIQSRSIDSAEREHLKELLAIQYGNLRKLERQEALHGGIDVPLMLMNQLDKVRHEIARLEARLATLEARLATPGIQEHTAEPRQESNIPDVPPANCAQPTSRRGDTYTSYETAIEELLRRLSTQHERYSEALIYQQRLAENIHTSRRYGDTETTRAGRAQIVGQLNGLALDELGISFNRLM